MSMITGRVRMCLVLASSLLVQSVIGSYGEEDIAGKTVTKEIAILGRALSKGAMLIPLLIGISVRLAALVPAALLGVVGIFIFVGLSKKAFIISLVALLIAYQERQKNSKPKIVHIHQMGHHHPEIGALEFEHPTHSPHKLFEFPFKKQFRKWPKSDSYGPWEYSLPHMGMNTDSYLPQTVRRVGNGFWSFGYPEPKTINTTETSVVAESIAPELKKIIGRTAVEDEDPR